MLSPILPPTPLSRTPSPLISPYLPISPATSPLQDAGDDDEGLEGILDEPDELPVAEAVASVRADEEPFNWVLIGPRP